MTDLPKDDAPASAGPGGDAAPAAPWAPATDAGTEASGGPDRPKRAARRAPAGDEPRRRRPSNEAAATVETASAAETVPAAAKADAAAAPDETPPGDRIAKAMARAGIASRRDAEAMILAGRVSVNGAVIASPALNVTEADTIVVDGEHMPSRERSRLWIFHKPRGLVTTARDPEGRQTVFEVLPEDMPRVVAVGRLDINTEGLLLLTNDGGLAKVIAHPDTGWLRRYRVRAHGDTDQAQLDRLAKGVTIDGMEYGPIEATLDRVQGDNLWLTLGLREGKNREVKRILEHLGLRVNRLIRLSFGPFQLGDLEVGLVEEVRTRVLKDQLGKSLSEQAGVDFDSPVREPIPPFGSPKPARAAQAPAADRPRRDAARPSPQRASTGGSGPGPRRSVWRSDEGAQAPHGTRVPRRGADPRAAQAAAAERGRERVGSIRKGERRVVVERLTATPQPQPQPEAEPRRRFARNAPGPAAGGDRPSGRDDRPPRAGRPDRPPSGDARPPRGPGRGGPGPTREGDRRDAGRPPARRGAFGEEPPRGGDRGPPRGRSTGGDKPAGGRPPGGKAPGGRPGFAGGKSSFGGGKPAFGNGKPGGQGRGGPGAGGRPPGGGRPQGPGGRPQGAGGRPHGAGGRPPGGGRGPNPGGRPPRGGR